MRIKKALSAMSLREKAKLLVDASFLRTVPLPDYGIPELVMTDGTNGVRLQKIPETKETDFITSLRSSFDSEEALSVTFPATCFPTGSSLACSFDVDLCERIAAAIAEECKNLGVGMLYGPGLNTRRTPLDGRGFEYYSEDPCLAGDLAAAFVNSLQKHGIAACIKHFACNNSNYMRTIYDSIVEERALREIYLAAFERVVKKADPASIMGSYNLINGVHACENHWLLTDVLRGEWGFNGMILSDCGAIKEHIKSFRAGIDFEMAHSKIAIDKLVEAVETGEMTETELDEHCEKVLAVVLRYASDGKEQPIVDFATHHALACEAAAQCAVLLKNEGEILPLDRSKPMHIAVLGKWAKHPVYQGTGCAIVRAQHEDIPLQEISSLCGERVHITYEAGYDDLKNCDEELLCRATAAAQKADVTIVFAGSMLPPESDDYNRKDMCIEPAQERLIQMVSAVNKNVIVVLMNGESVEMPWLSSVRAVLDMWYCGEGCGNAVAQLLFGEKNPCGKLPVTIPVKMSDMPGYLHFPGENHKHYYDEGLFVGYRYYEKKELAPLFPFGYGLSYTKFQYADMCLSEPRVTLPNTVTVSFTITNTGSRAGHEIAQLYVADGHARLARPVKELKHFAKVFLEPKESKTISFVLEERDFAYYDPAFGEWIVDTGWFQLLAGSSSQDTRLIEQLYVESPVEHFHKIEADSHYLDIFENPYAKEAFFDTLIEWGFLKTEDVTPQLEQDFAVRFWGMAQHLDLIAPNRFSEEMVQELLRRMNAKNKSTKR